MEEGEEGGIMERYNSEDERDEEEKRESKKVNVIEERTTDGPAAGIDEGGVFVLGKDGNKVRSIIKDKKPIVEVELSGPSGNTVQILANAKGTLEKIGCKEEAKEMVERFWKAKGYEEALEVIGEYVELRKW